MQRKDEGQISYQLSVKEAFELYDAVPQIAKLIDMNVLCLADNHLTVNMNQFVIDRYHLTEYARIHPDECCVGVIRESGVSSKISESSVAVLDMMIDAALFSEKAEPPKDNQSQADKKKESGLLLKEKKRLNAESANWPADLGGTLKKIMKDRHYTVEKLAEDTGLSEGTIKAYRGKPKADYSKKNIVAMAIAMHLHPWYTEELLRKANLVMTNVEPDPTYRLLYTFYYKAESLWECNDIVGEEIFKRAG